MRSYFSLFFSILPLTLCPNNLLDQEAPQNFFSNDEITLEQHSKNDNENSGATTPHSQTDRSPCLDPSALMVQYETYEELKKEEILPMENVFTDDVEVDPPFDVYTPAETKTLPQEQSLTVNLKNPEFVNGVISTSDGGVITAPGIRIQAQKMEYTNKIENGNRIQKIKAEGDLLMEYGERVFVGNRLEYDFVNQTGVLWDGKTFVDMWFLGGDKIELKEDGTFYIFNAFITTCETQENTWEIKAKNVKITKDQLLSANNIRFQFLKVPLFWLPAFKSNLKVFQDPPIRYKIIWDKGLGPRLTMRYRIFSWQNLNLFFRLDYRLSRGPGAAFESEYFPPDGKTTFVTRSYGAYDKTFPNEKGPKRYRLQGLYHTESQDGKTIAHLTYDKFSDTRMIGDYRSEDFEINTQRRTHLVVTHARQDALFNFSFQPRINRFQSIDQELPLIIVGVRPFYLGSSPIISSNHFNAGYLDYVYATDLRNEFRKLHLHTSTHALRLETHNTLYCPIKLKALTVTPSIGAIGIFYSNNAHHDAVGQGMFTYGVKAESYVFRQYSKFGHIAEPYLIYQGLTRPPSGLNNHFYFDINDGYFQLNQVKMGIRNAFTLRGDGFSPAIVADLYTYAYFGHRAFSHVLPKYYLDLSWHRSFFSIKAGLAWNQQKQVWDFTNVISEWTINRDFAFAFEFRHRSKYDWRKGDHENFFLDVARPIPELVTSPLSDGRDTLLSRFFFRLTPKWTCQLQTRNGWGRKKEPSFNTCRIDLFYMLTCSWRVRLSYERMPNDNRFTGSVSLVK